MSTYNICFYGEIKKQKRYVDTASYLELWLCKCLACIDVEDLFFFTTKKYFFLYLCYIKVTEYYVTPFGLCHSSVCPSIQLSFRSISLSIYSLISF